MPSIKWNPKIKLVLSDVDETVADLYLPAKSQMTERISGLLEKGIVIFFITGQGKDSVYERIVSRIPPELRFRILIGHCSGAEVWGFAKDGKFKISPYYSVYNGKFTTKQKKRFREIAKKVIDEFDLKVFKTMPVKKFMLKVGSDPLSIMYEDRGPQITLEMPNSFDLSSDQLDYLKHKIPNTHGQYDLRLPILERYEEVFGKEGISITPRLGGEFAIDLAPEGVSKTTAVETILSNAKLLALAGIDKEDISRPENIEIWGDKFSAIRGGTDRHMCEAVSKNVRAIDFRMEDPDEFLRGYNIVVWDGEKHLHDGLLEYLES